MIKQSLNRFLLILMCGTPSLVATTTAEEIVDTQVKIIEDHMLPFCVEKDTLKLKDICKNEIKILLNEMNTQAAKAKADSDTEQLEQMKKLCEETKRLKHALVVIDNYRK